MTSVQVEQSRRDDYREDEARRAVPQQPRDQPADERAGEPEDDRHQDAHRVRPRQGEARERAHDEALEGENEDQREHGALSTRAAARANVGAMLRTPRR